MSFQVSALSTFNDEFSAKIVYKAILESDTMEKLPNISEYAGVRGGTNLKLTSVTQTIDPKEGDCGFSATGSTVYSQKTITPVNFEINLKWCPDRLKPLFLGQQMKYSTHDEDFTESQFVFDMVSKQVRNFNDQIYWTGDTDNGDLLDGILTELSTDVSRHQADVFGMTSSTNVYNSIMSMYDKYVLEVPEALNRTDNVLLVSNQVFALFTQALRNANLFNYGQHNDNFKTGLMIPGTNVKVLPLNGLGTSTEAILTYEENLIITFDGKNDEDLLNVWWSNDNQEIRGVAKWTLGCGFHFGDHIVTTF